MNLTDRYKSAKRATIVNASVNSLLAIFKVAVGIIGHSQALVADGLHSFSDLVTDMLVLFAAKFGAEGPDADHPYGHRRIETVASIIISLILIGVAFGIAWDTIHHILGHHAKEMPTYPVIIVAIVSIIGNEFLYHYTLYEGNKSDSDLLRTNAWHNRSDSLVSIVVLVSVVGTMLGARYLDSIGAFIISLLILKMGIKMIWTSVQELVDAGVEEKTLAEIRTYILDTDGVVAVHQIRTRSHGSNIFLDAHIQVDPFITVSEGHYISEKVHLGLINNFEKIVDVTVHIDPEDDETSQPNKNLPERKEVLQALKNAWQDIASRDDIRKIVLHYLGGKIYVEIVLPVELLDQGSDENLLIQQYKDALQGIDYIAELSLFYQ